MIPHWLPTHNTNSQFFYSSESSMSAEQQCLQRMQLGAMYFVDVLGLNKEDGAWIGECFVLKYCLILSLCVCMTDVNVLAVTISLAGFCTGAEICNFPCNFHSMFKRQIYSDVWSHREYIWGRPYILVHVFIICQLKEKTHTATTLCFLYLPQSFAISRGCSSWEIIACYGRVTFRANTMR